MTIKVLSLFGGYEGARIALDKMGITPTKFYSSEVEKSCIDVVSANYSDIIHLGDVTKWQNWDIDYSEIDLIIAGSPCQGFSCIGEHLAFDDPRSKLFFVFEEILNHAKSIKPDIAFILENVRMKKWCEETITERLGVNPVGYCASLVSGICRDRLYWASWEIEVPMDRGITLSSVLGFDAVGCSRRARYINGKNGKTFQKLELRKDDKANCMTTVSKNCKLFINGEDRYGTVEEYSKLQGVPVDYFNSAKKTNAIKMLGNGFQIDAMIHNLSTCPVIN